MVCSVPASLFLPCSTDMFRHDLLVDVAEFVGELFADCL